MFDKNQRNTFYHSSDISELLEVLTYSTSFSNDLLVLKKSGVLEEVSELFSDLWGAKGAQDPKWHPEGNTFEHVLLGAEELPRDATFTLRLAWLCHDIGKPLTFNQYPSGGISNKGHAAVGGNLFIKEIAPLLSLEPEVKDTVYELIKWHMTLHNINNETEEVYKYLTEHPQLELMMHLQHADSLGTGQSREARQERSKKLFFENLLNQRKDYKNS